MLAECGAAPREARGDRRHSVRGRNRADDRTRNRHREEIRRHPGGAAARVVRRIGADSLAQVRRLGLHVGAGVESYARAGDRPPGRPWRHRRARRDRGDHGRGAPPGVPRDAAGDGNQTHPDHHPRRNRGARARPRHPRHAAIARQHPRRADDDRREIARRHAQRRGTSRRSRTSSATRRRLRGRA